MITRLAAKEIKSSIVHLYLLYFLPAGRLGDFRRSMSKSNPEPRVEGEKKDLNLRKALPEACFRIVAFHQAKREPDVDLVSALIEPALTAERDAKALNAFKEQMHLISAHPGRAKMENRLHRNKGCRFCAQPCQYGYFTLVSDPDFSKLQAFLSAESKKPVTAQTPLLPVYLFTIDHLMRLTGSKDLFVEREQAANLAYCLLMLGLAKSRLAFPEAQVQLFQSANQQFIRQVPVKVKA